MCIMYSVYAFERVSCPTMFKKAYFLFLLELYERLLQISGFWPVTINRNNFSLHQRNILVLYSTCAAVVLHIGFCFAALSLTYIFPGSETPLPDDLCVLYVMVLVSVLFSIYVSQYAQLNNLKNLQDHAIRVLRNIQQIKLKTQESYTILMLVFTTKTIGLLFVESFCLIKHLLVLTSQSSNVKIQIFIWVVFHSVVSLLPDVVFGLVLILSYHFRILNQKTIEILADAQSTIAISTIPVANEPSQIQKKNPHSEGIRMQICCDLSDSLDELAVLHQELSLLTCLGNNAFALQMLIWTIWSVTLFVIKLYMVYVMVSEVLSDDSKRLNKDLFFGLFISLSSSFVSVACLASACSRIMAEVKDVCWFLNNRFERNYFTGTINW